MQVDNPRQARLDSLRREIEQAFSDPPYPGDDQLVAYDDYESEELKRSFKGKHWRDIPRDVLRYHYDDLPFFSSAGLRCYLPAFLMAALDVFWDIRDFAIYELAPFTVGQGGHKDLKTYFQERFGGFAPVEKKALRSFLEFVRDELADSYTREKISSAIEQYWGQF